MAPFVPMVDEVPVEIPYRQVPEATLRAIAEDFCTRAGTDYSETEMPLDDRVALLMRQLERGEAHLVFEATTETLRFISDRKVQALRRSHPG